MFVAVRKYRVRRGSVAEWAQRVQTGFVPLMRELEGFEGYYLVDGGEDVVITISMFDSTGLKKSRVKKSRAGHASDVAAGRLPQLNAAASSTLPMRKRRIAAYVAMPRLPPDTPLAANR